MNKSNSRRSASRLQAFNRRILPVAQRRINVHSILTKVPPLLIHQLSQQTPYLIRSVTTTLITLGAVGIILWFLGTGTAGEITWGSLALSLVFAFPCMVAYLGAKAGCIQQGADHPPSADRAVYAYLASLCLLSLFIGFFLIAGHGSQMWLELVVAIYGYVPYRLAIPVIHLSAFTLAYMTRRVLPSILLPMLCLAAGSLCFGMMTLLEQAMFLGFRLWWRSAFLLDDSRIVLTTYLLSWSSIAGCLLRIFTLGAGPKAGRAPGLSPFVLRFATLAPAALFGLFHYALLVLLFLRYAYLIAQARAGHPFA